MPAKSQAQRGYLAANFGVKWMQEHHYNNKGKLPDRVGKPMGHTPVPMKAPMKIAKSMKAPKMRM